MHYLAFCYPNDEGGWGFTVPDIEGFTCDAGDADLDAALTIARRTLADHLAVMADEGLAIPEARRPDEVLNDPGLIEERELANFFTILPAIAPAGRTMRINVTIDEATLALADRAAGDRGLTRSAFIAEACRRFAVGETFGLRNIVDAYQKRAVAPNFTARVNEAQEVFARTIADLVGDQRSGIVAKKGRARL